MKQLDGHFSVAFLIKVIEVQCKRLISCCACWCSVCYSDELVSSSGGEQPAVGRDADGQNAVVVLEVEESIHRVCLDIEEAQSPIAACRGQKSISWRKQLLIIKEGRRPGFMLAPDKMLQWCKLSC